MRAIFLDCFSGISGDMTAGALLDLGVPYEVLRDAIGKLGLPELAVRCEKVNRAGIEAVRFIVEERADGVLRPAGDCPVGLSRQGAASEHHGRTFSQIREMISRSGLSEGVKTRAVAVFRRIAEAEGKIHGMRPDRVHFHEVGALDSIADIVAACAGFEWLGAARVLVSALVDGTGWVECAHCRFSVPAPATVEILKGIPLRQIDEPFERITPTGAAIVAEFGEGFGPMPAMRIEKVGYGAGSRDVAGRPNVLRAVVGDAGGAPGGYETDTVMRVETNLDDVSPEIAGSLIGRLIAIGALDAFFTPVQMKKNRPGFMLTALCPEDLFGAVADLIFSETTAFGLRVDRVDRLKLARRFERVETPYGEVTVKIGTRAGETLQVAPEFDSCMEVAGKAGVPLRAVYEAAVAAFRKAASAP